MRTMATGNTTRSGPLRDGAGVAKFRHEAVAAVMRVRPGEGLTVLAYRRGRSPFKGRWALPSGAVEVDESLDESVLRHLVAKVGVDAVAYLEQLQTRSAPGRDPFDRTIATAYLGLLPWDCDPAIPDHAAWVPVEELPEMAFDHDGLARVAVERLRAKLSYTNVGYALAPDEFTVAQLRDAYAAVLGHDVSATNLQRILQRRGQLVATGERAPSGVEGGRPARLYRFTQRELAVTDPFVVFKP